MSADRETITVEFTVKRTYRAEIDTFHFPMFPALDGEDVDDDAETIERYIARSFNAQATLNEYYANSDNWDGDEPEVDVDEVVVER